VTFSALSNFLRHHAITGATPHPGYGVGTRVDAVFVDDSPMRIRLANDDFPSVIADIDRRGASLVGLWVDGVESIRGFPVDDDPPLSTGIIMAPWPNRIRDGRWREGDREHQLVITEPDKNNAIHGLSDTVVWDVSDATPSSVTLRHEISHHPGYPFCVVVEVTYTLTSNGIDVTHRATNTSDRPAPFATGAHPYIRLGDDNLETATVIVPASTMVVSNDRLLPIGHRDLAGDTADLRAGRVVSELDIDVTYRLDGDGPWQSVFAGEVSAVTIWQEDPLRYMHVFTTRLFPGDGGPVTAVAMEPTSAPADSFNSGEGLTWLTPNTPWQARWGIRVTAPGQSRTTDH